MIRYDMVDNNGVFSTRLEMQFKFISELKRGWDKDDDDSVSVSQLNIERVRRAIAILVSKNDLPEPDIGAVSDGRIDIEWKIDEKYPKCKKRELFTVAEDSIRIMKMDGGKIKDISIFGDENECINIIVNTIRNELNLYL